MVSSIGDDTARGDRLGFARDYEERFSGSIAPGERPCVHLPARIGWMNDPNGFSYYRGRYHLFYQYYPFETKWGSMHWGHAVSGDLLHWDFLPVALAPDEPSVDGAGCFSGSALALPDGRHMLMYTGVSVAGRKPDGTLAMRQTQCIAFGDGVDYEKYEGNPVIGVDLLPSGASAEHFRDPKVWIEGDGSFRCVVASLGKSGLGQILLFRSEDGLHWEFDCVFARNDVPIGTMWECPDTFELDGVQVLLVSPQNMLPEGDEFVSGNGTLCLLGRRDDETGAFVAEARQAIDYGLDFYAAQTTLSPDGRRIMIAWMQNWDSIAMGGERSWFGQMTLPRELSVRDGRLCQQPVRELELARRNRVAYESVDLEGERVLEGVSGRIVDLSLAVRPFDGSEPYREFAIRFAQDERFHTSLSFRPAERMLKLDRKHSGLRRAVVYHRTCAVPDFDGTLTLRIVLDRCSVEIFVGGGERVLTMMIPTDQSADRITFFSDGRAVLDVEKYDIEDSSAPGR